jgi:hypothetical protein
MCGLGDVRCAPGELTGSDSEENCKDTENEPGTMDLVPGSFLTIFKTVKRIA